MIDAERAGVAHVLPQQLDEGRVGPRAQRVGRERRQAPVLPLGAEVVRRRADPHPARDHVLLGPGIGAVRIDPHREVEIEPDRHAGVTRGRLRRAELLVREPLQELEEGDPPRRSRARKRAPPSPSGLR